MDDLAPVAGEGDAERRGLTGPLASTDLAIIHYRLGPGERGSGLHAHLDQEEVFVVVEGGVTVETLSGETEVDAGERDEGFLPGGFGCG